MSIGSKYPLPSTFLPASLKPQPPLSVSLLSFNVSSSNGNSKNDTLNIDKKQENENSNHLKNELLSSTERLKRMTAKADFYMQEKEKQDVIIEEQRKIIAKLSKEIEQIQQKNKNSFNQNPFAQKLSPSHSNSNIVNIQLKHKNQILEIKEQHRLHLDQQKKRMREQRNKSSSRDKAQIDRLNNDLISLQEDKLTLVKKLQESQTSHHQSYQKLNSQLIQLRLNLTQSSNQLQYHKTLIQKQKKNSTQIQKKLKTQIQNLTQYNQNMSKRFQEQLQIIIESRQKMKDINFDKELKQVYLNHKEEVDNLLHEKNDLLMKLKETMMMNSNLEQILIKQKEEKRFLESELQNAIKGFQNEFMKIKDSFEKDDILEEEIMKKIEGEKEIIKIIKQEVEKKNIIPLQNVEEKEIIPLQNTFGNISEVMKMKQQNIQTFKVQIVSLEAKIVELQKCVLDQKNSFSARQQDYVIKLKQAESSAQYAFLQLQKSANQTMNNKVRLLKQEYNQVIINIKNQNQNLKQFLKESPSDMLVHEFEIKNRDKIIEEINEKVVRMVQKDQENKNKIEEYQKMVMKLEERIESENLQRIFLMEEKMIEQEKQRMKVKQVLLSQDYLKTPVKIKKQQHSEGISSCQSDFIQQPIQLEIIKIPQPIQVQPNPNFIKKPTTSFATFSTQTISPITTTTFQQTDPQQQPNQSNLSIIDNLKDQLFQKQTQVQKQIKEISQLLLQFQNLQRQFETFSSNNQKQKNELSLQIEQYLQRLKQSDVLIIDLQTKMQVLDKQNQTLRVKIEKLQNSEQNIISLQSQKDYLQTDLFAKTTALKNIQTDNQQLKLLLAETQTKLQQAMITITNNKYTRQTVIAQKELIQTLRGELACKSISLQQIQSTQSNLSYNLNQRLLHLQNLQTQLQKTTEFKNQLNEQFKNKVIQIEGLKQVIEQNHKNMILERKQMMEMIHNLEDKLYKEQNNNKNTSELEMLLSQINHLKSFIDVKEQKHEEQINNLISQHRSDTEKYSSKITELQRSIHSITEEHFKIKGSYEIAIGKEKKFREKINFILNGIKVVEEGIMEDLTSSLLKENNHEEEELHLSKLSQSFENMVEKSVGVKQEQGETTLKREILVKSNETQKIKNHNGIVSVFDHIEILGKLPLTTPPPRPKQK